MFLDWTRLLGAPTAETSEAADALERIAPSLVLAADVVFDPQLMPALAATLRASLAAGARRHATPPTALVSSTVRSKETYSLFLEALGGSV